MLITAINFWEKLAQNQRSITNFLEKGDMPIAKSLSLDQEKLMAEFREQVRFLTDCIHLLGTQVDMLDLNALRQRFPLLTFEDDGKTEITTIIGM